MLRTVSVAVSLCNAKQLLKKLPFKCTLAFYLTILALQGYGQISLLKDLDSDYFQLKVKSLDDFFGRFNYEMDPRGNPIKYSDSLKCERYELILSLFDKALFLNMEDSTTIEAILDFLLSVVDGPKPIFLDYYSLQWYAEATSPGTFNGKKVLVTFEIRAVFTLEGYSRWEIYDARSSFLDFGKRNPEIFIGSVAHNLNFLDIPKTVEFNPNSFINLLPGKFIPDNLSVITFLVNIKALKLGSVEKLQFHVMQVPGFTFIVNNLNREGSNSGWLITELKRIRM